VAVANFATLARHLSLKSDEQVIIVTGQRSERSLLEEFRSGYDGSVIDATALGSISMTASILSHADLLVSNDTGVMHLGAAVGTPTIGLFGATLPQQWAPFGPRASYVYATKLSCSPCIDSYRNIVPTQCRNHDYRRCMADISDKAVLAAARSVIRGNWLD
jgi:ADP-heptose:LPS heptosyltransferase